MLNNAKQATNQAINHSEYKVAVIHDWLVIYGGAERVLEHILDCYPQADLFSLIDHVPEDQRHFLRGKTPKTSFLQSIPGIARHYPKLLPMMPLAIEQFDLSDYDLVISSSYCVAKGVLTGPNQTHVSYCHSPMRYAWDHYHEYLAELNLETGMKSWLVRWLLHNIRTWDTRSSNTVDYFISNSKFVQARIQKFYNRESELIYPPIDTSLFALQEQKEDFYVAAGRFVPFKRLDLVVEAFRDLPDRKLVMIGDGPEMEKLRSKAGPNVEFLGFQPPHVMRDYLSRAKAFIFPSEEDFGIVPVEAQACGTPVIAFGSGGALETVIPVNRDNPPAQSTGLWFAEQSPESLAAAVLRFEAMPEDFDPAFISTHAAGFAPEQFKASLMQGVQNALDQRAYVPQKCSDEPQILELLAKSRPVPARTAPQQRFGVPVSLEPIDQANQFIAAVTWQDLKRAGENRSYQYLLNQFDQVVPYDKETLSWITRDVSCDQDVEPLALEQVIESQKIAWIGDNNAPPRVSSSADCTAIKLPREVDAATRRLEKLAGQPYQVLIFSNASHATLQWLQLNRAALSNKRILCLPADTTPVKSSLLKRLQRPQTSVSPTAWWRKQRVLAIWKRVLDVAGASLGLLALSPLLALTALLIRAESKGAVLFTQERVGRRGKTFKLYKFRSMYQDAEQRLSSLKDQNESADKVLFKVRRDPRVTHVGRIIRRLSVDELPQLINVLRGEMTLVGPRPALPSEVARYTHAERRRLQLKPGLTCLWQVNGRSDLSFKEQVNLDLTYASQQSPSEDMAIILKTIPAVISGKGAY